MSAAALLAPLVANPAPPTPLGPLEDGLVATLDWVTLMGVVGVSALALLVARPAAERAAAGSAPPMLRRLARVALVLGALAVPASMAKLAKSLTKDGGYDVGGAWATLYDGSNAGRLAGLGVTFSVVAVILLLPLALGRRSAGLPGPDPRTTGLLLGATLSGAVALGTTKFPAKAPADLGRSAFETLMWFGHLVGAAFWVGGLIGLATLALPGLLTAGDRGAFWSVAIRRFSLVAMTSVTAVSLSGLWLYWTHVDGPAQLLSTMYGQVLSTKLVLFGSLMVLGAVNQFWLHPRIEALRAAGEERPLAVVLVRHFPAVVAVEVVLAVGVLMVAPFLHGSARNQAFQAEAARDGAALDQLPKISAKEVSASTVVYGTAETLAVILFMVGGYRVSGRLVRRPATATTPSDVSLVDA